MSELPKPLSTYVPRERRGTRDLIGSIVCLSPPTDSEGRVAPSERERVDALIAQRLLAELPHVRSEDWEIVAACMATRADRDSPLDLELCSWARGFGLKKNQWARLADSARVGSRLKELSEKMAAQ